MHMHEFMARLHSLHGTHLLNEYAQIKLISCVRRERRYASTEATESGTKALVLI